MWNWGDWAYVAVAVAAFVVLAIPIAWALLRRSRNPPDALPVPEWGSPPDLPDLVLPRAPSSSVGGKLFAGLVVTAIMLPGLGGAATVGLVLVNHKWWFNASPTRSFVFGTAAPLAIWLLSAPLFRRFGDAATADDAAFHELCYRAVSARKKVDPADTRAITALAFAGRSLGLYPNSRPATGLRWASGSGYVVLGRLLHSAEESLIPTLNKEEGICEGLNARACLSGSKISDWRERIARLDIAIRALGGGPFLPNTDYGTASPPSPQITDAMAFSLLRTTRQTINEFRDHSRDDLVASRTALFGSVVATGSMAYLLLGLALLAGAGKKQIVAGVTFYVIGALVGLFKRLYSGGRGEAGPEDDFAITTIRLVETPLFAGLAAVGGVLVTSLLPTAAGNQTATIPSLTDVFSLHDNAAAIIAAAVFALAPNVLVNILEARAKQSKANLATSQSSAGGTADGATP